MQFIFAVYKTTINFSLMMITFQKRHHLNNGFFAFIRLVINPRHLKSLINSGYLKLPISALLIIPTLLAGFNSCKMKETNNQRSAITKVDVYIVKPSELSIGITSTGELLPNEQVELKAPVSGNVMAILFNEGEKVNQGDPLIQIDDRTMKARKHGLEARLISARNELHRKKNLLKIEGASQEEVDQAEALVEDLNAQIEELNVKINLARVDAPFSGKLGMRNFSPGAFLSTGELITQLAQIDPIKVHFSIPAKYADQIHTGQLVTISSSGSGDTSNAEIYAIDPVIDPSNRSLQIRALLNNSDHNFIAGDYANIKINIEQGQNALLVPAEAVIPELNTHVVYKVENSRAVRQQIDIGTRTSSMVQALSGVSIGDTVIVTGLLEISQGDRLTVGKIKEDGAL